MRLSPKPQRAVTGTHTNTSTKGVVPLAVPTHTASACVGAAQTSPPHPSPPDGQDRGSRHTRAPSLWLHSTLTSRGPPNTARGVSSHHSHTKTCSRDRPWLPPAAGVLPPAHWSSLTFIENFVSEFCTHTGIPMAPGSQIQQQAHSWPSLRSHSPGDPRPLLQLQVLRPPGNTHTGTEQKTRSNGKQLERGFNKKQGLDCSDVCRAQSDKNTIYQTPSLFTPSGGSSCEVPPPGEPQCSLQLYGKFAHLPLGHQ